MPAIETLNAARRERAHDRQIGLHAGQQQQQQDAELRDGVDHRLLLGLAGNSECCSSGQSAPSTEGPSRMPAISWPITAGWPIRCITSPISRPQTSSAMICADEDRLGRRVRRGVGRQSDARNEQERQSRRGREPNGSGQGAMERRWGV